MRGVRTRLVAMTMTGVLSGALMFAACGSDTEMANGVVGAPATTEAPPETDAPTTTEAATTTTTTEVATTTTAAPTTEAPTTTTIVETTVAPTTTIPPTAPGTVPTPIAPPADTRGQEPVIELGSIEIPKINLSAAMFEGIRLTTLDRGPGHWPGTAMPGAAGNVVVAGHRTSHSKPFRHLEMLAPGDEVIFNTSEGRFVYNVTSTEVVYPDAVHIIDQTVDHTATLFACHPVGSTKQRIVIHLAMALG